MQNYNLIATSNFMTKLEFQDLQSRAASSGTTLKEFLRTEGVAYSTYNYWSKKIRSESATYPVAPITLTPQSENVKDGLFMQCIELPGVTLAFPNGVKAHFGSGSENILMEVLSQSMR